MKDKELRKEFEQFKDSISEFSRCYRVPNWPYLKMEYWLKDPRFDELEELKRRFELLLKHLNLEYFKREIKETNGHITEKVEEGFRLKPAKKNEHK